MCEPKDEIELKKQSVAKDIQSNPPVVSASYNLGLSKTVSGSYINNLDVPTGMLPGNFGARVVDFMMPTNLSDVHRDRRSTNVAGFVCDNKEIVIPMVMEAPDEVDYLTDDESDDGADFEVKVPALDDLINEFEKGDEVIAGEEEAFKNHCADLKLRGFELELRGEIKHVGTERATVLDKNMSAQRALFQSNLPGMVEDLNEVTRDPSNKCYLR